MAEKGAQTMAQTCWIKDEHGKFSGRRPGCKMVKGEGSGLLLLGDSAANVAVVSKENEGKPKVVDIEMRIQEIINKPASERTREENEILNKYIRAKAAEISQVWKDGLLTVSLGLISGADSATAIAIALASGVAMDEIMKYANEKFGKWGPIGIALAAAILAVAKVKYDAKSAAKAEKRAAEAIAERKAAEAESKAAENSAMTREKLGEMYDETVNRKYDPRDTLRKQANVMSTGDISADEAKKINELAEKAANEKAEIELERVKKEAAKKGRQLTQEELDPSYYKKPAMQIGDYKTEASQWGIEHSMEGHASHDIKLKIASERLPHERVSDKYITAEEARGNVPLKKEDYQHIEDYREQAIRSGTMRFEKINPEADSIVFVAEQDDGVIHLQYKIDHDNKKMTFYTMYKSQKKKTKSNMTSKGG